MLWRISHFAFTLIGFSITPPEIAAHVSNYIVSSAVSGWANLGATLGGLRNTPELRWANPLEVKNAVEAAFAERFVAKETAKPKGKVLRIPFSQPVAQS